MKQKTRIAVWALALLLAAAAAFAQAKTPIEGLWGLEDRGYMQFWVFRGNTVILLLESEIHAVEGTFTCADGKISIVVQYALSALGLSKGTVVDSNYELKDDGKILIIDGREFTRMDGLINEKLLEPQYL
ncbi:MAG: hypothetical protein LBJ31_08760 [Treponema sp.]|jgi:hypothetical protein|nr:hypothetical protein [Treponema sp.]